MTSLDELKKCTSEVVETRESVIRVLGRASALHDNRLVESNLAIVCHCLRQATEMLDHLITSYPNTLEDL